MTDSFLPINNESTFIMKNNEKNLAMIGAAVFLTMAAAIGAFIRKL